VRNRKKLGVASRYRMSVNLFQICDIGKFTLVNAPTSLRGTPRLVSPSDWLRQYKAHSAYLYRLSHVPLLYLDPGDVALRDESVHILEITSTRAYSQGQHQSYSRRRCRTGWRLRCGKCEHNDCEHDTATTA
jgi:hypothetical protein